MLKFLTIIFLVASANSVKFVKITRTLFDRAVENPRSCGGQGSIKEVRITNLKTGVKCGSQPCVLIDNDEGNFEFDFIAGHSSDEIKLIVHAVMFGITFEIINMPFAISTKHGELHTIPMKITVPDDFSGSAFVIKANVYGHPGNTHHICGEINARVA